MKKTTSEVGPNAVIMSEDKVKKNVNCAPMEPRSNASSNMGNSQSMMRSEGNGPRADSENVHGQNANPFGMSETIEIAKNGQWKLKTLEKAKIYDFESKQKVADLPSEVTPKRGVPVKEDGKKKIQTKEYVKSKWNPDLPGSGDVAKDEEDTEKSDGTLDVEAKGNSGGAKDSMGGAGGGMSYV